MTTPPEDKWVTAEDLSKRFKKTRRTIDTYRFRGLRNRSGTKTVKLQFWKTIVGYVTTNEAIKTFNQELDT